MLKLPDANSGRVLWRGQHRANDARVRACAESCSVRPSDDFRERRNPAPAAVHSDDRGFLSVPGRLPDPCAVREHERRTAGADARGRGPHRQLVCAGEQQAHERHLQRVDGARRRDGVRRRGDGAVRDQRADRARRGRARGADGQRAERDAAAHHGDDEAAPLADRAGGGHDAQVPGARGGQSAVDAASSANEVEHADDGLVEVVLAGREYGVEATGRDALGVDVCGDDIGGLHDLAAQLGAEGVLIGRGGDRVYFGGEHGAVAEGLFGGHEAFGESERARVLQRGAVVLHAVVVCGVECAGLEVHDAAHVDRAGAGVCELELAVAVGRVYVGDELVPEAVLVVFWVIKMHGELVHAVFLVC